MNFRTGLIIWMLLFLVSCECKKEYKTYTVLGNGQEMVCAHRSSGHCGIFLRDCKDGNEYSCLQNVILVK